MKFNLDDGLGMFDFGCGGGQSERGRSETLRPVRGEDGDGF